MKTAATKIQDIVNNTLKYIPGGSSFYQREGWSHRVGRKAIRFGWELRKVEEIKKSNPELIESTNGRNFTLASYDSQTDTEYSITIEYAQYIGRPDYIIVDILYNKTIAYSD